MLTQERLKQALRYSPVVGVFERMVGDGRKGRPRKWKLAGTVHRDRYVYVSVDGELHRAHRLAWLYCYGVMPEADIDHIDGDRSNNAISNLRLATQFENMWNLQKRSSNKSGVKGVYSEKRSGKWVGQVKAARETVFHRRYDSLEQAELEVRAAREKAHGEFANHGVHKYIEEMD